MRSSRAVVVLLGLTCAAAAVTAAPAAAEAGHPSRSAGRADDLEERNRAFLAAVRSQRSEQIAGFFSRTGNWRYVHTAHYRGGDRRAVWEFPAAETLLAIRGPLNQSFDIGYEGQLIGTLSHQEMHRGTHSRRVRGNRFVPPGPRPDAAIYVEWRQEARRGPSRPSPTNRSRVAKGASGAAEAGWPTRCPPHVHPEAESFHAQEIEGRRGRGPDPGRGPGADEGALRQRARGSRCCWISGPPPCGGRGRRAGRGGPRPPDRLPGCVL